MISPMHTWNTIKAVNTNKLDQATAVLETLQNPVNASILEYIQEHQKASFLDLALHLQCSAERLELQLERLCRCQLLIRKENIVECHYVINEPKLRKAKRVAKTLSAFYRA